MFKSKIYFVSVLLLVYVLLFEFILPLNNILPKPSLLLESIIQVWTDYNLLSVVAISTTAVYLSLIISYIFVYLTAGIIIKIALEFPQAIEKLTVFKYFPAFFFAILFSYWFGDSFIAELIFTLIASIILMIFNLVSAIKNHNQVFTDTALNIGLKQNTVYTKVIFKDIQPRHFSGILRIHYYLWILAMIYEFINGINGFGGVYRVALLYRDFTGLFSIAIIISILILAGSILTNFIKEKLLFWE